MAANPVLGAIGLLDFTAAFLLVWSFPGTFMLVVSMILLAKGIWSILSSIHSGYGFDAFGALDFFAALVLLVVNFGTPVGFAWLVGVILALKAGYTMLSSV